MARKRNVVVAAVSATVVLAGVGVVTLTGGEEEAAPRAEVSAPGVPTPVFSAEITEAPSPSASASPSASKSTPPPDPKKFVVVKAKGDGRTDDTGAVQAAINTAADSKRAVWLPAGTYLVAADLDWAKAPSIVGDPLAPAVLHSPGNKQLASLNPANGWAAPPLIDNVVFDGLRVNISGPKKQGLVIKRSVFISRTAPGEAPSGGTEQENSDGQEVVGLQGVTGATISDNVFLSTRAQDGAVPVSTYQTRDLTVSGNLLGADLSGGFGWWAGGKSWTQPVGERLAAVRDKQKLPAALGHLQRGMSLKKDIGASVVGNVVNRDPRSRGKSDHALYAWGFDGLKVSGNWLRGWPQAGTGGMKVRNGKHATISGNYLDGTAVLMYTYDVSNAEKVFEDVVVCRNTYDIRNETPEESYSGIMYWRNFEGGGVEKDIAVFDNTFLDPQKSQAKRPDVSASKNDESAFSAAGNTAPVTGMKNVPPTSAQKARCGQVAAPKLAVPVYR